MKLTIGTARPPVSVSGDLATYLQQMRDEERADLARELHDELGSLLTGAKLEVATMKMHVGDGSIDMLQRLQHLGEIINSGISFSRRVVEGLHPSSLTNLGLTASLQILAREFQRSTGITMVTDLEEVELDEAAQLTVYRLVQESLTNTGKYAGATDARVVMLGCGSHAVVTVRDNGTGFDTVAKGPASHGLAGMLHRVQSCGGQLTVSSAPGLGTVVTAVLHARAGEHAAQASAPSRSRTTDSLRPEDRARALGRSPCKHRRTGRGAGRALINPSRRERAVPPTRHGDAGNPVRPTDRTGTMINIGIVDDHAIVRSGLRRYLSQHVDLRVVGEAANGREAIDLVRASPELDVLVLDLSMPGQSGSDTLALLRAKAPDLRVLILSAHPEEHYATDMLRQGAAGYLNKQCEPIEIVEAIRTIALGRRYISPSVAELLAQQLDSKLTGPAHQHLSKREWEVFIKLAKGENPGTVAAALSVSVKTVSTYRSRLLEKMQLASNTDLTHYALKNHLID